jgi:O-glycosyl hydrolase
VLDADGQPNVGKHPCGGLFTIDIKKESFTESIQAKLFRQFSPYVDRGAKVLSIAEQKHLRSIAFQNPNGDYVVCDVANNIPNKRQSFQIKCRGEYKLVSLPLNTWSMTTIIIENNK